MNCELFQILVWKKGGKGETRLKEVRIFTIGKSVWVRQVY